MKRLAILAALLLVGCGASVVVTMPYCPVSDSAWAHTDSIAVACLSDTISQHRKHR